MSNNEVNGKVLGSGVVFFVLGFAMGIIPILVKPTPKLPELYAWWVGCFTTLGLSLAFFGISRNVTEWKKIEGMKKEKDGQETK